MLGVLYQPLRGALCQPARELSCSQSPLIATSSPIPTCDKLVFLETEAELDLGKQDTGSTSVAGQGGGRTGQRAKVNRGTALAKLPLSPQGVLGHTWLPLLFRGPAAIRASSAGVAALRSSPRRPLRTAPLAVGQQVFPGPRPPGSTSASTPGWCAVFHR